MEGVHVVNNIQTDALVDSEWDEEGPEFPLSPEVARALMDEDGFLTVVVEAPKEAVLTHYAYGLSGGDGVEDLAHRAAFSFGLPHDCSVEIVGVSGQDFLLEYTTSVREVLASGM